MRSSILCVAVVGAFFGCSSSSNGGTGAGLEPPACTNPGACGGNIVGSWSVTNLCGADATGMQTGILMNCPTSSATGMSGATGTLTFNGDSTYSAVLTSSGGGTDVFPKSCLNGATCAQIQQAIMSDPTAQDFSSITCTDDGTNCNCTFVLTPKMSNEVGTYSISGSTVTTTPTSGGTPGASVYCVNGTELALSPADPAAAKVVVVAQKK